MASIEIVVRDAPLIARALNTRDKFANLREIRCSYSFFSDEIIQRWTVDLKNKLQLIRLDVREYELRRSHLITSTAWRNLAIACPQLKVDLYIFHFYFALDVIQLLVPGIPLRRFYMLSLVKIEQDLQLANSLTHLADNFDQELEIFKIVLPHLQDSVDNEIVRVVETCRKLTIIRVPASAAFGVATVIFNDFNKGQLRNVKLQIGRGKNMANSDQDIVKTIHEMFSKFPYLKVEWDDTELDI